MRITFIINTPERDEIEQLRGQVERLRGAGHEVHPRITFEAGDGRRMAREAAATRADLVIAAGGDGTINEAANGIHDHLAAGSGGAPRLGIVPLGTANDLAAVLAVPTDPAAAVEAALAGPTLEVDVGLVAGRCFLNVSTAGFGAEATEEASSEVKRAVGSLAYLITGARKFVGLEVSSARFVADDLIYEGPFLLYAVGNTYRTGGGNRLTPRADPTDGLLDLCIVREISRMEFAKLLPDLRSGEHLDHPAVVYRQVPRVRVDAAEELSINVDGEPLKGCRSVEYRVSPHRIALAIP